MAVSCIKTPNFQNIHCVSVGPSKAISNNLKMPISLDECATNASPVNENWKENIATTDAHASNANGAQDTLAMWKHFKMPITHVEYATMPVSSTTAVGPVENLPATSTSVIVDASTIVPEDTLVEYAFKFPTKYAGLLIGKKASYKKTIKETTGANLFIFNHLSTSSSCVSNFSNLHHPNLDLLKKTLPLNCFTYVRPCCIVSPGRIFVQILSEDFWTLKDFTDSLTSTCDHFPPPTMPYVKEGDVCVYRRDDFNFWCRTKVLNVLENGRWNATFMTSYLQLDALQWSQQCQQEVHRLVFASSNAVLRVVVLGYNGEVPIVQVLYAPYAPHNDLSRHLISVGLARSMTVCARSTAVQLLTVCVS
ncbi:hypothetical protein CEXT_698661 [Caerostris extrusa]|uniref:Tudor domain-containing protein n=1 Tax=Caerostris extrusa TaxID=172846 RepID=A0AAV4MDR9_CAEEX|nr:hypothetical protein CEXT_698661 [Caerostris extrusa]